MAEQWKYHGGSYYLLRSKNNHNTQAQRNKCKGATKEKKWQAQEA